MTPKTKRYLDKYPRVALAETATLRDAMAALTETQAGIALVVAADKRLLGILVDSDIRKALLRGAAMESPATTAMNPAPFTLDAAATEEEIAAAFRQQRKSYIPLIDKKGRLEGVAAMVDYISLPQPAPNWVVIMAGGQGRRLRPLTNDTPKPMMRIGERPLLELVMERLVASGLNRFVLSVNYLADKIQEHFGDGSRLGAQIEYVREDDELGTAGALSLITRDLERSFIVMNGDLLTKVNFRSLLDFHESEGNLATVCLREYDFQVPYGVVQVRDHKLAAIVEKPIHRFFVNAGIYVLEPSVLARLKPNAARDMPDLLEEVRRAKEGSVGCFPVQEYWLDIGKMEDYKKAVKEYDEHFLS